MKNITVVGAQWGDEGKAKITDLLAEKADLIIRYQGGCNAGHTVVANGIKHKFHLIPSGILYENKTCFIGCGTVILPEAFNEEVEALKSHGINVKNLKISPLASVTMPYHIDIDGISEKGENKIGTTKKGIGPTYTDKISRHGLKIQDLFDKEALSQRLDVILPLKNKILSEVYGLKTYEKQEVVKLCAQYKEIFAPYVDFNWQETLNSLKGKTILFEGAQGVMLDVDYGTYPYVTSSNPIAGGACVTSGLGPQYFGRAIGVFKAYITRVGEGPFVSELDDEIGDKIRQIGAEYGTTTGRPRRCGWFDAVNARYSALVGGLTEMAITKLDVFDTFDEILVCTAYKDIRTGEITQTYPTQTLAHKYFEPVYKTFRGWKCDITGAKTFESLPQAAREYLGALEELVGLPISIVSVGPDREQSIFVN